LDYKLTLSDYNINNKRFVGLQECAIEKKALRVRVPAITPFNLSFQDDTLIFCPEHPVLP
jgi:hypothetical protein